MFTWRGRLRADFRAAHLECIAAVEFFVAEVWTLRGLVMHDVRLVVELNTGRISCRLIRRVTTHRIRQSGSKIRALVRSSSSAWISIHQGRRFALPTTPPLHYRNRPSKNSRAIRARFAVAPSICCAAIGLWTLFPDSRRACSTSATKRSCNTTFAAASDPGSAT